MTDREANNPIADVVAASLASGDPTGWFEPLYAAAANGEAFIPWDRGAPHRLLVEWAQQRRLAGHGRQAMIVGSGLGDNAEYVAGLGFTTVAFDVSATAIRSTRQRFPDSRVDYLTADLLDPPAAWRERSDLVVEIFTVQSLPQPYHAQASANVGDLVAPGGTLVVIAAAREATDQPSGPPWPLSRSEIDAFADTGLQAVRIEDLATTIQPFGRYWRAEFTRPAR